MHSIRGLSAPVSNDNIAQLYGEAILLADTETFISPLGGLVPDFPSDLGEIIQLVSADTDDVGTIIVTGLDTDFIEQTETIVLNGLIPVFTTKLFTRINWLSWREPQALQGQVLAQNIGGTVNYRSISTDAQLTEDAVYTVPANRWWHLPLIYAAIVKDPNTSTIAAINLYYRPVGFAFRRPFRYALNVTGNSSATYENLYPYELKGPVDLYLSAESSDAGLDVVARLTVKVRPL